MTRLTGGLIDGSQTLNFKFDGKRYQGHPGDTLASALLANDVRLVARSFKYHRPRGLLSAGSEEPNALVELRTGARQEPNTLATTVELFEGLEARSQNRWPSLDFDAMAVNDLLSPLFTAGFYYKTFMWPKSFWEKVYEPAIRKAAGLGSISMQADPDTYDRGFLHCDLLVIGGGPAGLAAALTAARAGARVILAEEDFRLGGRLLAETETLGEVTVFDWIAAMEAEFNSLPSLRIMRRTTVFGAYDHGVYGAVERISDHLPHPGGSVRQTFWRITAKRAVLAAGAIERPMAFADNDRPGIMLAGALRAYANRWAACPSETVAVFTNNDDGHRTARDLAAKGVQIAAVIDVRPDVKPRGHYRLIAGGVVTGSRGRLGLTSIEIQANGRSEWIECGALGVSGGWNPNVHLASHHRGHPVWNERLQAFLPGKNGPPGLFAAGAAAGDFSTAAALRSGSESASVALEDIGIAAIVPDLPRPEADAYTIAPFFHVPGRKRAWVDFQNDVTVKDIKLAHAENMRPLEHLKRYTTLGMATDQGKTANVIGLAVMSELTGKSIQETGTTIFRPPYTPVAFAVLGGGDLTPHFPPSRLTPTHDWAEAQGAVFDQFSPWRRADYFRREGETHWRQSVDREAQAVRSAVGLCDVSTLGKIDVQGADAGKFLDQIYSNIMSTLKVSRVRYGLMLREDGFAYDDGTCARLAEEHYVLTTTTANADLVHRNMDFARQCLWPDFDVQLISTTEAWAQIAVAGPSSRALLARIVDGFDLANEAFPFMACSELTVCGGLRARLFRVSFVGELGYEIAVPTRYGLALMERLMEMGADLGVTPFGVEALSVLGMEKGHVNGGQLNGQTTAEMLGLGKMVSEKKDSIGAIMSRREGLAGNPLRLVGLQPVEPAGNIVVGSHLFTEGAAWHVGTDQGWVTSACYSPHLGSMIGLAFLENGYERAGEVIVAANPVEGESARLRVVSPHFVDAEGVRLRG
ncbi:sarcosine oxidase subunit alpha family protein [Sinorhizobium meliloti]|nr:sarcosine oxidase subunit alpha family protein [Sinorhizobium meliloti]MDX0328141.1 sarcosine oxidase subunit alpha family protein [Sinorhizobium meliloti]